MTEACGARPSSWEPIVWAVAVLRCVSHLIPWVAALRAVVAALLPAGSSRDGCYTAAASRELGMHILFVASCMYVGGLLLYSVIPTQRPPLRRPCKEMSLYEMLRAQVRVLECTCPLPPRCLCTHDYHSAPAVSGPGLSKLHVCLVWGATLIVLALHWLMAGLWQSMRCVHPGDRPGCCTGALGVGAFNVSMAGCDCAVSLLCMCSTCC